MAVLDCVWFRFSTSFRPIKGDALQNITRTRDTLQQDQLPGWKAEEHD